ncbi:MAG: hypothetical protein QGF90_16430 [Gammaproteobacteria bacterium]|nr:hypothetical protein [Gammaproteobacteria bacterium]
MRSRYKSVGFARKIAPTCLLLAVMQANHVLAQDAPTRGDDATVTYPATYFEQYEPFSVADMLDRIPGINVARQQGPSSGGPGSSQGARAWRRSGTH